MNYKFLLTDRGVIKRYIQAGRDVGEAVSYFPVAVCGNLAELAGTWAEWEKEYASRGFAPIDRDTFVQIGGYDKPLDPSAIRKRLQGEEPVFHAKSFSQRLSI